MQLGIKGHSAWLALTHRAMVDCALQTLTVWRRGTTQIQILCISHTTLGQIDAPQVVLSPYKDEAAWMQAADMQTRLCPSSMMQTVTDIGVKERCL